MRYIKSGACNVSLPPNLGCSTEGVQYAQRRLPRPRKSGKRLKGLIYFYNSITILLNYSCVWKRTTIRNV